MLVNLYKLKSNYRLEVIHKLDDYKDLLNSLVLIEDEIANLYYKEQAHRRGVTKLGDQIRRSKKISQLLTHNNINRITFNRSAFLYKFLKIIRQNQKNLFFFTYSPDFNAKSHLVDNTCIKVKEIIAQMKILEDLFKVLPSNQDITFIEVQDFTNYDFEVLDKTTSRIFRRKNVKPTI